MSKNKVASPGGTVTAIDIVLEPDATMIQHAQSANAALRKNFPKGYSLDAEHKPHISVMGGYFYTANLDKTYAAVEKFLATEKVLSWKMKAIKYYYMPLKEIGLAGIVVEPTTDMIRLQKKQRRRHVLFPAYRGALAGLDNCDVPRISSVLKPWLLC